MINTYDNCCVYEIYCKDTSIDQIYVGSTCNLKKRIILHKSDCYNENSKGFNLPLYKFIRENGGFNNFTYEVLDDCIDVNCKEDLLKKERMYYDLLKPSLNSFRPCITLEEKIEYGKEYGKEYYENNKERFKEYGKEYYENNKQKVNERRKDYYENNKQKVNERRKDYYENNKKKVKQKVKEYYENNKQKVNERRKEKITCECGRSVRKDTLSRHKKSKIHLKLMEQTK